jgi:hypothetical protein
MAGVQFSMVDLALHRDPRWRRLKDNDDARHVYLSLLASPRIALSGLFHCPRQVLIVDGMFTAPQVDSSFEALSQVGLLEFNEVSEFVRLVGWYYTKNLPQNLNQLKTRTRQYLVHSHPKDSLASRSIAEMAVAVLQNTRRLRIDDTKDQDHAIKYLTRLILFLRDACCEFADLPVAFADEYKKRNLSSSNELAEVLSSVPQFQEQLTDVAANPSPTVPEPLPSGSGTVPEHYKERRRTEKSTRGISIPTAAKSVSGPHKATIDSHLARLAKRESRGG